MHDRKYYIIQTMVQTLYYFTGPLKYIMNNRLAVALGRLSYSVFLVNITVIMMSHSTMRSPFYLSDKSVVRRQDDIFISEHLSYNQNVKNRIIIYFYFSILTSEQ